MTSDLRTQIRDYTEFFVSTVESVDLDEIRERPIGIGEGPVRPIRPLAPSSPRRGWPVAVAAAAAVLVLAGGAALLLRVTGSDSPVATTLPTDLLNEWSRVPHDEPVFSGAGGGSMSSVTFGGPGLVAVGDGGVWTSVDGIAWSQVPHDAAVFGTAPTGTAFSPDGALITVSGEGSLEMVSVTAGGPGLVAVGQVEGFAAVWTSVDGITWSRVPHDEAVFGAAGTQRMNSVTVGGPGLVAVGGSAKFDPDEFDPDEFPLEYGTVAAVWTSPDGFRWSRVPHSDAVFDSAVAFGVAGSAVMTSVTAGGPGLVAVGEANVFAAVWTSPDGITWSPVFRSERVVQLGKEWAMVHTRMSSVTAGGPGLVAVGSSGNLFARDFEAIGGVQIPRADSEEATAAVWVAASEDG